MDEGTIGAQLVRDFLNAMNLRQAGDYEAEFSQSGARAVIASAERFLEKATAILDIGIPGKQYLIWSEPDPSPIKSGIRMVWLEFAVKRYDTAVELVQKQTGSFLERLSGHSCSP